MSGAAGALGLSVGPASITTNVLEALGVSRTAAHDRIVELKGAGACGPNGRIPFAPDAKAVLETAVRGAIMFGHSYVGTEHPRITKGPALRCFPAGPLTLP